MRPRLKKINTLYMIVLMMIAVTVTGQTLDKRRVAQLRSQARIFEQSGQVELAVDFYSKICHDNPKDVAAYMGVKRLLMKSHDYDQFETFIKTLQKEYRDVRFSVDLALVDYNRGNEKEAKKKWDTILEDNPKNQQAHSLVGRALTESGLYEESVVVYLNGRDELARPLVFTFELAMLYKQLGRYDDLMREYLAYLEANPNQISFVRTELQREAETRDSRQHLIKALQKGKKSASSMSWSVYLFLGDLYAMDQQFDDALEHYLQFERFHLDQEKHLEGSAFQEGKILFDFARDALSGGQPEHARLAFDRIINEFPKSRYIPSAELGMVKVYLEQRSFEPAIEALDGFIDRHKGNNDVRFALILKGDVLLTELFDIDKAVESYQTALNLFPQQASKGELYLKLADCYTQSGDFDKAASYLINITESAKSVDAIVLSQAYLKLAYLEFYQLQPRKSLDYLNQFYQKPNLEISEPNVVENDILNLLLLIEENQYDSTGLAVLGHSKLLTLQRKYTESLQLLEQHLPETNNALLRDEMMLQRVANYQYIELYQNAVALLDSLSTEEKSLYRDFALLSAAEIYETEINNPVEALQRYEKIVLDFPNSIYVDQARKKVRQLVTEYE